MGWRSVSPRVSPRKTRASHTSTSTTSRSSRTSCEPMGSRSVWSSSCTERCGCSTYSIRTATAFSLPKSFPATEVEIVLGTAPARWATVESGGYGRVNAHWRAELHDGRSVFVKQAKGVDAEEWLRRERRIYESVRGSFMPTYLGAHEDSGSV